MAAKRRSRAERDNSRSKPAEAAVKVLAVAGVFGRAGICGGKRSKGF